MAFLGLGFDYILGGKGKGKGGGFVVSFVCVMIVGEGEEEMLE